MWIINTWLVLCNYNFFSSCEKMARSLLNIMFFGLFHKNVVKICCRKVYIKEKNCNFAGD